MSTPATPAAPAAPPVALPSAPPPAALPPAGPGPEIHPMTKKFIETLNLAVGGDISAAPIATDPGQPGPGEPEVAATAPRTLGDMALEASQKAAADAEKKKAEETPPAAQSAAGAPAAPAAAVSAVPAQTPTAPAPIVVKKPAVDELAARVTKDVMAEVKKLQTLPPPAPATPPPAPSSEQQWEASLPEDYREMMELLRWAETEGNIDALKGKAAEQSAYFRKLEEFMKTNPEAESLQDWTDRNNPAIPDRLLRKAAEQRLLKQARREAAEEIRAENEARLTEIEARQRSAEVRPLVDRAVLEFGERFEKNGAGDKTKAGTPRVAPAAAMILRTEGFDAAAEAFPIEAGILHQFNEAAQELLRLRSGLVAHDPMSPTHQFLSNFIFRQEQALMAVPEGQRIINGKLFLPASVYYAELNKDPSISQRYSTFTDENLLDLLEEGAHRAVNREYARLEKAGFSRKTILDPTKATEQPPAAAPAAPAPAAPAADDAGAPRAGASKAPGAAAPSGEINPNLAFLKKALPGSNVEAILAQP